MQAVVEQELLPLAIRLGVIKRGMSATEIARRYLDEWALDFFDHGYKKAKDAAREAVASVVTRVEGSMKMIADLDDYSEANRKLDAQLCSVLMDRAFTELKSVSREAQRRRDAVPSSWKHPEWDAKAIEEDRDSYIKTNGTARGWIEDLSDRSRLDVRTLRRRRKGKSDIAR
jgi:hypothetical protein